MTPEQIEDHIKNMYDELHKKLGDLILMIQKSKDNHGFYDFVTPLISVSCQSQAMIAAMSLKDHVSNNDVIDRYFKMTKDVTIGLMIEGLKNIKEKQRNEAH